MIIDPKKLSKEEEQQLSAFFAGQLEQGIHMWRKGVEYTFPGNNTKFSFPCDVVERARKNNQEGSRFEFISNEQDAIVGKGSYGTVYKVMGTLAFKETGYEYHEAGHKGRRRVVKVQGHHADNPSENAMKEYSLADAASHLGAKKPTLTGESSYSVMKMLPGKDLLEIIVDDLNGTQSLTLQQRYDLTLALLNALKEQVTDKDIIHRDLKGENIRVDLLTEPMTINIFDFGLSRHKDDTNADYDGSFVYVAPELIRDNIQTVKGDVFSMGRLVALLWHTEQESYDPSLYAPPYMYPQRYKDEEYEDEVYEDEVAQLVDKPVEEEEVDEEEVEVDISRLFDGIDNLDDKSKEEIRAAIGKMLKIDPEKRSSIKEAIDVFDTIKIIEKEPAPVLNSAQALDQMIQLSTKPVTTLLMRIKQMVSNLDDLGANADSATKVFECMDLAMEIHNQPAPEFDETDIIHFARQKMAFGRICEDFSKRISSMEKEVQELQDLVRSSCNFD